MPESGDDRTDDESRIADLMAAVTVALTAFAIAWRKRTGAIASLTAEAAQEMVAAHIEAALIGQAEWSVQDAQKAASVATEAVYGKGNQAAALARWEASISSVTTDKAIAARAAAHAGATWASYQQGRGDGAIAVATDEGGEAWAVWRRDNINSSCTDCTGLDGQRWPVADIPQWPGDGGTQCLSNCRCQLEMTIEKPKEQAA